MLGIGSQRHQFCRFIWFRETRGSEYFVHCLFVYHTSRTTDVDHMLTMLTFSQNIEGNKDGDMPLREIWISLKHLFACKCPDCGSPMASMLDMERDKLVYHCDKCDKDFITL